MKAKPLFASLLSLAVLCSCNTKKADQAITTGDIAVIHETKFDGVYGSLTIDEFNDKGFEFGDSVTVTFSNGEKFEDIPYYDGYYVRTGEPMVVGYPGYPYIDVVTNNRSELWQRLGLKDTDTMKIDLIEKGKYKVEQETFSMKYEDERNKYTTDEEFANYREMKVSTLKEGLFYRGASPVDNQHKRAKTANDLIEKQGINFILNLADNEEEVDSYIAMDDFASNYAKNLYDNDKIACLDMAADFSAAIFQEKLVNGLEQVIENDGPYYIHCTEGKDRTGFVCFFIEALSGATEEELEKDYMKTYDNYYGITEENNKDKYDAIVDLRFRDFVNLLTPTHDGTYLGDRNATAGIFMTEAKTLKQGAEEYLMTAGMNEENIAKLETLITKK